MCKVRRLRDEVAFWEKMASTFTKKMSPEERRAFNNLFETDFKSYVEEHLSMLIDDIEKDRVDTKLNLEQGMRFISISNCRFIDKELRKELISLIYPDFAKQLATKGEIKKLSFEEGMRLQDVIDCEDVEEEIRKVLRAMYYPGFIEQLIDDIQSGIINRDDISLGDARKLQAIIDSDIDDELCSRLSSVMYGADERS